MKIADIQVGETYRFRGRAQPGKVTEIVVVPEPIGIGWRQRNMRRLRVEWVDGAPWTIERAQDVTMTAAESDERARVHAEIMRPIREREGYLMAALDAAIGAEGYRLTSVGAPRQTTPRTHLSIAHPEAITSLIEVINLGVRERDIRAEFVADLRAMDAADGHLNNDDPERERVRAAELRKLGIEEGS